LAGEFGFRLVIDADLSDVDIVVENVPLAAPIQDAESQASSPRSDLAAAADDRYGWFAAMPGAILEAWMARHRSAVSALLDSDSRARLDAVISLEPNLGFGYQILRAVVLNDPDPEVRLSAVRQLGRAGGYLTRRTLLDDLLDSAPDVVLEILDLIEAWEDSSMVRQLRNLAYHPSEDVRQRSAEVIAALK
jgi:hypothetical protein